MTLSNITMIICTMHDLHHIILCITSSSCQAVVFPSAMSKLMDGTQISKARMLGGKLGKKVMSLLPESETTMGSISRLLPLDRLEKAIDGSRNYSNLIANGGCSVRHSNRFRRCLIQNSKSGR